MVIKDFTKLQLYTGGIEIELTPAEAKAIKDYLVKLLKSKGITAADVKNITVEG